MVARSTCLSPLCGARVLEKLERCPKCGRRMLGDDEIGRRGGHLLLLGLILAGLIGGVLWFWSPGMSRAIAGAPRTSFIGTADQAWGMLLGLGALLLAGAAFAAGGLMMLTGRSSRMATVAAILLFVLGLALMTAVLVRPDWG